MGTSQNGPRGVKKSTHRPRSSQKYSPNPYSPQINEIKARLDDNYHKLGAARRSKAKFSRINQLERERKNLIRELAEVREQRDAALQGATV